MANTYEVTVMVEATAGVHPGRVVREACIVKPLLDVTVPLNDGYIDTMMATAMVEPLVVVRCGIGENKSRGHDSEKERGAETTGAGEHTVLAGKDWRVSEA